ncbi:hypothetical protein [Geobacter pickeringii]|uniref:Uncharacterized protein n=1 Tax=Geobacter pickeringii TaxID=345632 RepID=A0A0B5B923_9BACT|nr:hypothetical protein [Geobacter pickeringii]AJE03233.1 hypothetical protein GPICK_07570 [Geobacter pickeringii]
MIISAGEGRQLTVPLAGIRSPAAGASRPSVLDRFLSYSGKRTIGALVPLFEAGRDDREMRQEPVVALSDGTTELLMTVSVEPADTPGLKFVLIGLHFLALQRSDDRHWQIRAVPRKGSSRASLMVVTDRSVVAEFPVTVAPPLEVGPESCAADAEVLTGHQVAVDPPSDILPLAEAGEGGMAAAYVHTANCLARGLVTPLRASVPAGSR